MTDRLNPTRIPLSLPRGRAHLPREVVLVSQRARLIEAAIEAVGTKGYVATTVGDIIKAARVSRSTFYEQFGDKEECFVAAYEDVSGRHFDYVVEATERAGSPISCLQIGVRAYLDVLSNEPAYARAALIEVMAAGPSAAASRDSLHDRFVALLQKWHAQVRAADPSLPPIPDEVLDCAVGGITDLVATRIRTGATEQLPTLAPVIVTFVLNVAAVPAGRELAAALSASRARRS